MKRTTIIVFFIFGLAATLFSGAYLDYFHARSDGNNITIEWKTESETGIQTFEVQRKAGSNGEYISIGSTDPKGSNSYYTFIDRSAFKSTLSIYVYRLKIVDTNGNPSGYSNEVTVSHNVSGVKRTWGSIKAMFR